MRGVNKVIIVGTLGNDPEVKQFNNGGSVTNISVATSEQWFDKQTGEKRENTEWHRISLFNSGNYRLGDIAAQYLRKGSQVYIEGSLRTRKYQDQTGQDRYVTEIRADNMQILGSKPMSQNGGYDNQGYQQNANFNQQNANQFNNMNQNANMNGMGYNVPPAQNFPQNNQFGQMNHQQPFNNASPTANYPQQPMDNPYMNQGSQAPQPPVNQTPPMQPQVQQTVAPQPPVMAQQQAMPNAQQPNSNPPPAMQMTATPKAGAVDDDIPF